VFSLGTLPRGVLCKVQKFSPKDLMLNRKKGA
jgi:hypothetical protein